jgi:hypothetical protein
MTMTLLNCRLRNCLLTILELEEMLDQTHLGPALQKEFFVLKQAMRHLGNVVVEENDICRIEAATSRFLAELKDTLEGVPMTRVVPTRFLQ